MWNSIKGIQEITPEQPTLGATGCLLASECGVRMPFMSAEQGHRKRVRHYNGEELKVSGTFNPLTPIEVPDTFNSHDEGELKCLRSLCFTVF